MSQTIDMMLKYPSILPADEQQTEFRGYLPINDVDYELRIKREHGRLRVDMNQQLQRFEPEISRLNCSDIVQVLDGLRNIITSKTTTRSCKNATDVYRHVLSEYVELREFYISMYKCSISQDLAEIRISHLEERGRAHDLVICTHFESGVFNVSRHSFPERKNGELFQPSSSLKVIYEKFLGIVEQLQSFFDTMDCLDRSCWVLDPEKPARKDCYRRIGFDVNVSMIVTFDPWSNSSIPNIRFLGPERLVDDFRHKVANNLVNWDSNTNAVEEILKLLELSSFPASPVSARTDDVLLCEVGECCICFSLRLNDRLPEIICQNASCEQFFHKECLYQWLVSVSAKQTFNELHGQCPNCEKHISCPL